jgi:hypothetical protein
MGRRQRKRDKKPREPVAATEYADQDGNVLMLRDELSPATVARIREREGPAAASGEDLWQRREELLFERLAVRWTIAGLPLEDQATLLGRYRMASGDERAWVRDAISRHVDKHLPGLKD